MLLWWVVCWLSVFPLSSRDDGECLQPDRLLWVEHFTSLMGHQEMPTLEKRIDPKVGAKLAAQLPPTASFMEIVKESKKLTSPSPALGD